MFAIPNDQEHGCNMTITVLNRVLTDCFNPPDGQRADQPRHLWLQLDNCGGENKNHPVMAYCALLVAKGALDSVTVAFLPVGHTHEDVDGFHAVHSKSLKVADVFNVEQMLEVVSRSHIKYKDNPFRDIRVEKLYAQRDWKRWFYPNWDKKGSKDPTYVKTIHRIAELRRFNVSLAPDGQSVTLTCQMDIGDNDICWTVEEFLTVNNLPNGEPGWAPHVSPERRFFAGQISKERFDKLKGYQRITLQAFDKLQLEMPAIFGNGALDQARSFVLGNYEIPPDYKPEFQFPHLTAERPIGVHKPLREFNVQTFTRPSRRDIADALEACGMAAAAPKQHFDKSDLAIKRGGGNVVHACNEEPAIGEVALILKHRTAYEDPKNPNKFPGPDPVWLGKVEEINVAAIDPVTKKLSNENARVWWYRKESPDGN